ncbi:MAG: S-methyl-5-thioribose-1-phosphate isomerase [Symbiobacteriaceae bacterium]|nr:S-methyl-5-thioribose-1-phosphate isomerase [Symbiobacteriaceae bacterium]
MAKYNLPQSVSYEAADNTLVILDQQKLPQEIVYLSLTSLEEVWQSIKELKVRGAPAIGIAAAWGLALHIQKQASGGVELDSIFQLARSYLASSRPTAVNLFWALDRMARCWELGLAQSQSLTALKAALLGEAAAIQEEDAAMCAAIGEHGLSLLEPGMRLLTHCNAGALATARYGTALAPIYLGQERGYNFSVFADETRPLLQGARLTTWELQQAGVEVTLICDSMVARLFTQFKIDAVLVGADRIAQNGDTANKIGTQGVALLAQHFKIPFYVLAPTSTVDPATPRGEAMVIEERDPTEVTTIGGVTVAPAGVKVYNPAFDVTSAALISAIITEKGVYSYPYMF